MIVDAHLDLAWCCRVHGRDYRRSVAETRRLEAGTPIEEYTGAAVFGWPEARSGGVGLVVATLFASPERLCSRPWETQCYSDPAGAERVYGEQLDLYHRLADDQSDTFCLVTTASGLEAHLEAWKSGEPRLGMVVLMEGADAVREPAAVEAWAGRGVRLIGPAWGATRYAGSASEPGPLTRDGLTLLDRMAENGLMLDVSHFSDRATRQALEHFAGTPVATHSNPRALLPEVDMPERHLADDVIAAIGERQGVIGVVLGNKFLEAGWTPERPRTPLSRLLEAIDHICQVIGDAMHVGIGSDVDGGFGLGSIPAGLDTIADLQLIGDGLIGRGYSREQAAAVLGENWLRVLRRSLP